jgi:hypothetical protein
VSASISTGTDEPPQGTGSAPLLEGRLEQLLQRINPVWIALGLFALGLVVYVGSNIGRTDFYDHFVWQAQAFLQGRAEIDYPVTEGRFQNGYFRDVLPVAGTGTALIPFPPLPAIILLPFVAIFGLGTNAAAVAAVLGAVNVALCWTMLLAVTQRRAAALLATIFYAFGTVTWYAAMLGTTWFLAHVGSSTFLFIAITLAVRADAHVVARARMLAGGENLERSGRGLARQFAAGLVFGVAALARLTSILAAPFFVFVGGGGSWLSRAALAGSGAVVPVLALIAYNIIVTGDVFHPAYEYLYQVEYRPRPDLVNPDWGIEDVRYIPQNLGIMLASLPLFPLFDDPACSARAITLGPDLLLDRECPLVRPDPLGMSLLLTSPGYLLVVPALLWGWRRRIVAGAALAVLSVAVVDLMHFSQGWVQFGYRFSNDFAPFATILVALGIARLGVGWVSVGLVALSVVINAWGVHWGVTLGW